MSILIYSSERKGVGARLLNAIQSLAPSEKIESYSTITNFSRRLRQPMSRFDFAVLLTVHRKELLELLTIKDLLADVPLVLILPDSDKDTVSKGHTLYPRLVTYADSDLKELCVFLKKMIARQYCKI